MSLQFAAALASLSALAILLISSLVIAVLFCLRKHFQARVASTSPTTVVCSSNNVSSLSWDNVAVYQSEGGEKDNKTFDRDVIQVATQQQQRQQQRQQQQQELQPRAESIHERSQQTPQAENTITATSFKDAYPLTLDLTDVVVPLDSGKVFEHEGDLSVASLSTLVSECSSDVSTVLNRHQLAELAAKHSGEELFI